MGDPTRPLTAVKRRRLALDLRQADVAQAAGISVSYLSMIESGYLPTDYLRERVAEALSVKPRALWPEVYA